MKAKSHVEKRRIEDARLTEVMILRYFQRNPTRQPDGCFVYNEWLAGYRAAIRDMKRKERGK